MAKSTEEQKTAETELQVFKMEMPQTEGLVLEVSLVRPTARYYFT